jgi:hypothetical protein
MLDALYSPTIESAQFRICIEQFQARVVNLGREHRIHLRTLSLPLSPSLLVRSRNIASSLKRIAMGYERILTDADVRAGSLLLEERGHAAERALFLLGEYVLTVCQAGLEVEPEIWRTGYRLYSMSRRGLGLPEAAGVHAENALGAYKRLLVMATLEPQSLTPAELEWVGGYVDRVCQHLQLQIQRPPIFDPERTLAPLRPAESFPRPPMPADVTWYWLDPNGGGEPQATIRRAPLEGRTLLYFSTASLAQRANAQLARHGSEPASQDLANSPAYPGVQPLALLERLRRYWASPPKRELPRQRQDYSVEACVGLDNIWAVLHSGDKSPHSLVSRWIVTNESPGGYAIMQLLGRASGLYAGMAVALRRNAHDTWHICIVRWIRNDSADNIEIGLETVSSGAMPVQIGFRGTPPQQGMVCGLVLPVMPALRQHQAVIAPAGTYISRHFTLVSDTDHLYVAQCRLLTLDLQTANIEMFQFEIDAYPN